MSVVSPGHLCVAIGLNIAGAGCHGDPPQARLAYWYSLMREKRAWRLDFLKAFLRGLSIELVDGQYAFEVRLPSCAK